MKVYKIYYETENGVEITRVLAKSRRSLTLPVEKNEVIKIVDVTEEFKNNLKVDIETIATKLSDETVQDIVSVLKAVELY